MDEQVDGKQGITQNPQSIAPLGQVQRLVIFSKDFELSKTKSNIPKSKRGGYDLWGRRPMSGCPANSYSKRLCRKIERINNKRKIKTEADEYFRI